MRDKKPWYEAHREETIARSVAWQQANPESQKAIDKTYREAHPERVRASRKKYYESHRDEIREKRRAKGRDKNGLLYSHRFSLKNIGVTPEEYIKQLATQKDCCAICGRHKSLFKKALHADHNHKSNRFRGILCESCNRGLGYFMDDVELLKKAILYLTESVDSD